MNNNDNDQLDEELDDDLDQQEPESVGEKKDDAEKEPAVQYLLDPGTPGEVKTLMIIGEENTQPMVMHTVSILPPSQEPDNSNIVKVRIKYPSKYTKPRFFKDGDVKEVAKETAEIFIKQGIAKIMIEEKQAE